METKRFCDLDDIGETFFEGVEKRVIFTLHTKSGIDWRALPQSVWEGILTKAGCTIVSLAKNEHLDAYILSESSLFVYKHEVIFKTCGTIKILLIVPSVLKLCGVQDCSFEIEDCDYVNVSATDLQSFTFTHLDYLNPAIQEFPHRDAEEEFGYLNQFFNGKMFNVGLNGGNYRTYSHKETSDAIERTYLEIQMFDLDPKIMLHFFSSSFPKQINIAEQITAITGIDKIFPGSIIDAFAFKPAGYSMNGLLDGIYWTIHVTPEKKCSYVSFETNASPSTYHDLLLQVISIFRPSSFNVNVLCKHGQDDFSFDFFALQNQLSNVPGFYLVEENVSGKPKAQKIISNSYNIQGSVQSNLVTLESDELAETNVGELLQHITDVTGCIVEQQSSSTFELRTKLQELTHRNPDSNALVLVNLGHLMRKTQEWKKHLPQVKPFYAVKCNPDKAILAMLNAVGVNFDCASKNEIASVLELDVEPDRIIFANPVKPISDIVFALENNVVCMTVDSIEELDKIASCVTSVQPRIVLRLVISNDVAQAQCPLGEKFGASVSEMEIMMDHALGLGLNIVGLAFHVGSGCSNPIVFETAIQTCVDLCEKAKSKGIEMELLDIGGGFTSSNFAEAAKIITKTSCPNLKIIAEPGRFFAAPTCTQVTRIIGKNLKSKKYHLGDGLYGAFNCLLFDHATVTPKVLFSQETDIEKFTLFGPTCDQFDCLGEHQLPVLKKEDFLYFENFGAYTSCAASTFNGIPKPDFYYIYT